MIELLLVAITFVAVSGFFAMIDAAILNVTPAEVEVLIAKKKWGSKELKQLLRNTTRAIIVIVIFTNITNILGPILVGREAVKLYGDNVIGAVTAILTLVTIMFSEIVPKSIGAQNAPRIARRVAPFLRAFVVVLYPFVIVLERFVRLFKSGKRKVGTEEQIRALANIGGGAGHIDAEERELIHRAFVLNDRKIKEIMTPRSKIVAIRRNATVRQAARFIFSNHFTRYPVIGDSLDDVRGYVLSKDVLEALADGNEKMPVTFLVRKILTVPLSMSSDDLLGLLRREGMQIAVVMENQETVGLVTLEDVLEELVGEFKDEGDRKL